jgi:hypothetical protein
VGLLGALCEKGQEGTSLTLVRRMVTRYRTCYIPSGKDRPRWSGRC